MADFPTSYALYFLLPFFLFIIICVIYCYKEIANILCSVQYPSLEKKRGHRRYERELPNSILRVVFDFSATSPARALFLSGGAAARHGHGGVAWLVHTRFRSSFSRCARFAYMELSESRVVDLGGQIRRAVAFFLVAAVRRWQAELHATSTEARISPNKVRTGSFELGFSSQP